MATGGVDDRGIRDRRRNGPVERVEILQVPQGFGSVVPAPYPGLGLSPRHCQPDGPQVEVPDRRLDPLNVGDGEDSSAEHDMATTAP